MFAAENHYSTEADLQQLRLQEDENLFVLGLQELLKVRGRGSLPRLGNAVLWIQIQYIEFGSGSRSLVQFGSGSRVIFFINLKETNKIKKVWRKKIP